MAYFLDSSAAVKLYVRETGTAWVTDLADPSSGDELVIVRITAVEIAAALFRQAHGGRLSLADATRALSILHRNLQRTYQVVELSPAVGDLAVEVARRHALRGYDCVQLAAALFTQRQRAAAGLRALTLASADQELNMAGLTEGLKVEDPNDHPT